MPTIEGRFAGDTLDQPPFRLAALVPAAWLLGPPGDEGSPIALRLLRAGADAIAVEADATVEPALVTTVGKRLRSNLPPEVSVLVAGSPALAGALGAGLLLAERGPATADARRAVPPGAVLARVVTSAAAAAAAVGADLLVAEAPDPESLPPSDLLRAVVEAAWVPVLASLPARPDAIASGLPGLLAAGAEGALVRPTPSAGGEELAASVAAAYPLLPAEWFALPPVPTVRVDGIIVPLLPDTAITDLLADLGRTPKRVSVNGAIVPHRRWDDTLLAPDDQVQLDDDPGTRGGEK